MVYPIGLVGFIGKMVNMQSDSGNKNGSTTTDAGGSKSQNVFEPTTSAMTKSFVAPKFFIDKRKNAISPSVFTKGEQEVNVVIYGTGERIILVNNDGELSSINLTVEARFPDGIKDKNGVNVRLKEIKFGGFSSKAGNTGLQQEIEIILNVDIDKDAASGPRNIVVLVNNKVISEVKGAIIIKTKKKPLPAICFQPKMLTPEEKEFVRNNCPE